MIISCNSVIFQVAEGFDQLIDWLELGRVGFSLVSFYRFYEPQLFFVFLVFLRNRRDITEYLVHVDVNTCMTDTLFVCS